MIEKTKVVGLKKIKYYLDSTIFNFVFADDEPVRRDLTKKFFEKIKNDYLEEIYISDTVLDEINETPDDLLRTRLKDLIEEYNPFVLEIDTEIKNLANYYVEQKIIPRRYINDAIHIAVAVVNDLDVIVSWNFEHIVKLKTRVNVNAIDRILGYHEIEICSPEEVEL